MQQIGICQTPSRLGQAQKDKCGKTVPTTQRRSSGQKGEEEFENQAGVDAIGNGNKRTFQQLYSNSKQKSDYNQLSKYNKICKYRSTFSSTKSQSEPLSFSPSPQLNQPSPSSSCPSSLSRSHEQPYVSNAVDLSIIEQQQSSISSLPLLQKFSHLLPSFMSAQYSLEQRKLFQMQAKLDEMLDFLRLQRKKQKETFGALQKAMRDSYQIGIEMENFRQILQIDQYFYGWEIKGLGTGKKDEDKEKGKNEEKEEIIQRGRRQLWIWIPEDIRQLQIRKNQFRKKMYEYLLINEAFTKNKNFKIPYFKFPFDPKQQPLKPQTPQLPETPFSSFSHKRSSLPFPFSSTPSTPKLNLNPLDALKPGNFLNFQQQLLQKIKQNEQKQIQAQKQALLKPLTLSTRQLLAIFNQLPKIYKMHECSYMFKSSLLNNLDKGLNIKKEIIGRGLDYLMEKYNDRFFKVIEHRDGKIVQIFRKNYNIIRSQIQSQGEGKGRDVKDVKDAKENVYNENQGDNKKVQIQDDKKLKQQVRRSKTLQKNPIKTEKIDKSQIKLKGKNKPKINKKQQ